VEEQEPLGTAGSLFFLDGKFNQPFFVTNCDIIIKADYVSLYEFHQKGAYDVTLVASAKEYIIPYGTCELNGEGYLSHINEKPHYDFLINTGLYVLNPDMLKLIPKNKFYHITHLIEQAKNQGKKIGVFPIDDDAWIDVGQWAEYKKVVDQL
jgi:NDP-sugar pyrophosphorylase family protein